MAYRFTRRPVMVGLAAIVSLALGSAQSPNPPRPPPAPQTQPRAGQPNAPASPPGNPPRAPQPGRDAGPWDNDLLLYRGIGNTFRPVGKWERGGVPSIMRDANGRLIAAFQWFPENNVQAFDRVALRYSTDDGTTWSDPKTLEIAEFPVELSRPFDPTLALAPDGKVRLFYSSRTLKDHRAKVATYSAIADDGEHFTFEPGPRFAIEGVDVIDCAVVCVNGVWHYFAPENGPARGVGYHAISRDGLKFERQPDVRIDGGKRWLGCATIDGDPAAGVLRFYGTDDSPRPGERSSGKIWTATSLDGTTWLLEDSLQVPAVDPGVALAGNSDRIVIATGPPRAGSPSARKPRPPGPPPAATQPRP